MNHGSFDIKTWNLVVAINRILGQSNEGIRLQSNNRYNHVSLTDSSVIACDVDVKKLATSLGVMTKNRERRLEARIKKALRGTDKYLVPNRYGYHLAGTDTNFDSNILQSDSKTLKELAQELGVYKSRSKNTGSVAAKI